MSDINGSIEQHPLKVAFDLLKSLGKAGEYVWATGKDFRNPEERLAYLKFALAHLRKRAAEGDKYRELPVDAFTFLKCRDLMDMGDEIYPRVMDEIVELCSGAYVEAVLTGGIGTGKTTIALVATAYALYELACMENPHKAFGLARSSEIVFIFQNLKKELAKVVDYDRFRSMLNSAPFFQNRFRYDRSIESEMEFPRRIIVKPVIGDETGAIGQNVFGGVIDEVNFMAVIENSKQSVDGGIYDQAKAVYNSIARRRQSRFMQGGRLPGMLCLVSSKRYPGEFTDRKIESARSNEGIFVYDKRVWDVKPLETFSGNWFHVFRGDESRKPRLLDEGELRLLSDQDQDLSIAVPEEYREAFEEDIFAALRDIAGVSTAALHPFILNSEAVAACFGLVDSVFSRPDCDFVTTKVQLYPSCIVNPDIARFAHIDLGVTGDSAGLAIGHVPGFEKIDRGQDEVELMPVIRMDGILEVRPPKGGEILFSKIREILYLLKKMGMNIKWVSMDSYQSVDTMQILRQHGFMVGYRSLDTDTVGYDMAKQAFYDGRIQAPEHKKVQTEFIRLERDPVTQKIDHPPNGSKDCSDAMAGVVCGLTMRREVWTGHGVPVSNIPDRLRQMAESKSHKNSIEAEEAKAA